MEEHSDRVVEPVRDTLGRYPGQGATLSDIQAAASAAAGALDGASAGLRDCLLSFDVDLEHARYALPENEHQCVVTRLRDRLEQEMGAQ